MCGPALDRHDRGIGLIMRPRGATLLQASIANARAHHARPESGRRGNLPCQRHDPELWFAPNPTHIEQAKMLCADCPIREACLAGALERGEVIGVWGGQLLIDGVIVAKKRARGRPRKDAA
jgi:WhiB family transcriptional regulator, redox-sensing transcriptional regulator